MNASSELEVPGEARIFRVVGCAIFLFLLAGYVCTAAPDVTFHDSGELISGAWCLGIPHPPGSPTWCLLAHPFSWIPYGSPGFRINLSSGFFGALACAGIFFLVTRVLRWQRPHWSGATRLAGAAGGAILLGIAPAFWEKSVQTEVYTLNALFLVGLLWLAAIWYAADAAAEPAKCKSLLIWTAFLFGIGTGNYMALLYYVPVFAAAMVWRDPKSLRDWRTLFWISAAFFAGLSVYLYLPVRSIADPPMDWGNPENWRNFMAVFKRERWGQFRINGLFWPFIVRWFESYRWLAEMGWAGMIAAAVGLAALARAHRPLTLLLLACFYVYAAVMLGMQATTPALTQDLTYVETYGMEEFHIPLYVIVAIFGGFGLAAMGEKIGTLLTVKSGFPSHATVGFLLVVAAMMPLGWRLDRVNFRKYDQPLKYGRALAQSVRTNGWIVSWADNDTFVLAYLKICRRERPDLQIVTVSPEFRGWLEEAGTLTNTTHIGDQIVRRTQSDLERSIDPILNQPEIARRMPSEVVLARPPKTAAAAMMFHPEGLVFRPGMADAENAARQRTFWTNTLAAQAFRMSSEDKADFRENMVNVLGAHSWWHDVAGDSETAIYLYLETVAYSRVPRPDLLIRVAQLSLKRGEYQAGFEYAHRALDLDPANAEAWQAEGTACVAQKRLDAAVKCFETALALDPSNSQARENLQRARRALEHQRP